MQHINVGNFDLFSIIQFRLEKSIRFNQFFGAKNRSFKKSIKNRHHFLGLLVFFSCDSLFPRNAWTIRLWLEVWLVQRDAFSRIFFLWSSTSRMFERIIKPRGPPRRSAARRCCVAARRDPAIFLLFEEFRRRHSGGITSARHERFPAVASHGGSCQQERSIIVWKL